MAAIAEHRSFLADIQARQAARRAAADSSLDWQPQPMLNAFGNGGQNAQAGPSGTSKGVDYISKLNVANYIPEEESVRNDYAAWYGASGQWGSNFVLGAEERQVCEEFPALKKLMQLKSKLVHSVAHPPLYLSLADTVDTASTNTAINQRLSPNRFDAILITPPPTATWDEIAALPLRSTSADPGFVFLWVGAASGDGLERGRETFAKWGFRRAEDIVWVKTNKGRTLADGMGHIGETSASHKGGTVGRDQGGLFVSQKEHCLMGIRGTVRRSTDGRFVHCNVDTDIMLWEDDRDADGPRYPPYLHALIENFCLGTRRLHLFGSPRDTRRGWVTVGTDDLDINAGTGDNESATTDADKIVDTVQPFDPETYSSLVYRAEDGRPILPYEPEIDNIRPKSPTRKPRNLPTGPHGQNQGNPRHQPNQRQGGPHFNGPTGHMSPPPQSVGAPGMGLPMGFGSAQQNMQMPMQSMYNQHPHQQAPFDHQQSQFDPHVLAQAQAYAQAQMMQMQMMMQMQAQAQMQAQMQGMMMGGPSMGMGMGMGQGIRMGMGMNGGVGMGQSMGMGGMGLGQGYGLGAGVGMAPGAGLGARPTQGWPTERYDQPQAHITPISPSPTPQEGTSRMGEDDDMADDWQAGE